MPRSPPVRLYIRHASVANVITTHGIVSGSIFVSTIAVITIITSILFMIIRILMWELLSERPAVVRWVSGCVYDVALAGRGGVSSADAVLPVCCCAECTVGYPGGRRLLGVTRDLGLPVSGGTGSV